MFIHSLRLLCGVLLGSAAVTAIAQETTDPATPKEDEKKEAVVVMEKFVTGGGKGFDAIGIMPNKPSSLAFGFDKALAETPRAITFVSSQQIESLGLHNT